MPPPRMRGRKLQAARDRLFRAAPLCVECEKAGRVTFAEIRDHRIPLAEGGQDIDSNVQGLCVTCHDAKSKAERVRGAMRGNGV